VNIKNKIAIVTGASSGVGEACAKQLVQAGAKVVIAARSAKALSELADALGPNVLAIPTDVSDLAACKALIEKTVAHFGGLDILINNAGYHARGDVTEISIEDMDQIIDVNLKGPMRLSKLALPHLQKAECAAIVNVASLAGRVPVGGETSYSTSKFGLRAFSIAMAEELAETPINVSVVSPGPIDTGFIMDEIDHVPDLVFSQPMSTSEEVAAAVLICIGDGKVERAIPAASGVLATAAYVLPALKRSLRPTLEKKGQKSKQKYLARNAATH